MKTLADFKRKIQELLSTGQLLQVRLIDLKGNLITDRGAAPVCKIQHNGFALQRENPSWVYYQTARHWQFTQNSARQTHKAGCLEFIVPGSADSLSIEMPDGGGSQAAPIRHLYVLIQEHITGCIPPKKGRVSPNGSVDKGGRRGDTMPLNAGT